MAIQAFIFDMDGTMIDSMPTHQRTWLEFSRRHGVHMDLAEMMRRTTGRTGAECMVELFGRTLSTDETHALVQEKEAIYRELFAPIFCEVTGFKAFLAKAHAADIPCAIGTASDAVNVAFVMSHLFTPTEAHWIPRVIVRGDMGLPGKPEPAIFLEAARRLGLDPASCLVFEDAPFGIEAARRAGMPAVGITSTHTAAELAGNHVIATTADYSSLSFESILNHS